jgi:simple sugar transport system ATP-binding protein
VTVLRHGKKVATRPTKELTKGELAQMMVGRAVSFDRRRRAPATGGTVLSVEHLWARDERNIAAVRDVSFTVRAGEVVGIAGVAGNGQTEIAEVLSGLRRESHGRFVLNGADLTGRSPMEIREAGLGHVPADRMVRGVDRQASIAANLLMGRQEQAPFQKRGILRWRTIGRWARDLIQRFDIRAPGPEAAVKSLSGGNIQKVVLAREFSRNDPFLLVDQPTRGVDIGSQEAIHDEIMRQREEGRAILLISVQLDELIALADRILVMFNGRIMGEVDGATASEEQLGLLMAGIGAEEPATAGAVA